MRTDYAALERALIARLPELGITRVADTTGLDRLGIPTASAVKPGTADVIWVYSGKGTSAAQARAVAIMECLERTCALWPAVGGARMAPSASLAAASGIEVWSPSRFTEASRPLDPSTSIPWVAGVQLPSSRPVLLPAELVYSGYRPPGVTGASPFPTRTSNGLAAGLDLDCAIVHALLEIAERDIVSHYEVTASHAGVSFLAGVAASLGIEADWLATSYRDDLSKALTVDPATLPDRAAHLYGAFTRAGLRPIVKALPNDFGLAAFGVACLEQITATEVLGCAGYAVRTNPERALLGALLELAQTRATDLQGAREDRHDLEKQRMTGWPDNHWLATQGPVLPYSVAVASFSDAIQPTVASLLGAFAGAGLADVAVVEFPAPRGIRAVRVLVPGVETWHCTGGEGKLGPRLGKQVNNG